MCKRQLTVCVASLAVIAAAINGCSIEQELPTVPVERSADQHIELVKGFFESQIGPLALPDTRVRDVAGAATRSTDETAPGLADAVEPDRERATVWEADNGVVTEMPAKLKKSVDYTVLVEKSGRQVSFTTQKPNVRVLVVEPRDGGAIYCMLATFLPDKGWGGKARDLAVGGKPGDYSGLLVYSLPDGTSALGWRYDGGEANHVIFFDNGHADRQDPDIRIAIGSSAGATTRADIEIEAVYCIGIRENNIKDFENFPSVLPDLGGGLIIVCGGGGGGGGGSNGGGSPKVKVANGLCVVGSIAAALQVKFGYTNATAIDKAKAALNKATGRDIDYDAAVRAGGIFLYDNEVMTALVNLGFTINELVDYNNRTLVNAHFSAGGFGIGHFNGPPGHDVFLMGYDPNTNRYSYYDSVTGGHGKDTPNGVLLYFN